MLKSNKGFTVVELIMSFAFVSILSLTLFAAVINYKEKEQNSSIESQLLSFKSKLTVDIQNDIQKKILDTINYCVGVDGRRITGCIVLNFKNGETKTLQTGRELQVDRIEDSEFTYYTPYILYGEIRYMPPDPKNVSIQNDFLLEYTTPSDALENEMALYKIRIPIEHNDVEGDMDVSIVALGTKNQEVATTPSYQAFRVGDLVTIQLNGTLQQNFYVIQDSSAYSDHLLLLLDHNLENAIFNENVSLGNSYTGSNIMGRLQYLTQNWNNATAVRLITAEELGYLVYACPSYREENARDVSLTSAPSWVTNSSYWTMSSKLYTGDNNGKRAWVVNSGSKVLTDDVVNQSYGIRPVIEVHKRYVNAKVSA